MKIKVEQLRSMLREMFESQLDRESVNRSRRGEDKPMDYPEEREGDDQAYESVNRARRGEDQELDYKDEYEGKDVAYEKIDETNLYTDSDKRSRGGESSESESSEDDDEAKSHAAPQDAEDHFPGPPLGEMKLREVAPSGWEDTVKKMKKHKDIDNPWALAWHMKNKGANPGDKDK